MVADVIVVIYLSGWLITSVALGISSRLLTARFRPARRPVAVSVLAGGLWLVLLVGAAQFGALVALSKALSEDDAELGVVSATVDELV
jgi:hypothetical protein